MHYLSYLQYWKKQEYSKFLKWGCCTHHGSALILYTCFPILFPPLPSPSPPPRYPQCLHFLDLLQEEVFRKEVTNAQCVKFIEDQQLLHWHHYTKKRTLLSQQQQKKGVSVTPPFGLSCIHSHALILSHTHKYMSSAESEPEAQKKQQT